VGPPLMMFVTEDIFVNKNPFQALIDLVNFDQDSVTLLKDIEKIEKEIHDLKTDQQELESEVQKTKLSLKELQKKVDEGELEMKELDQMEKEKKARLDRSKNQKEYMSLQKEIELIHTQQHDLEEPLLTNWNKLETAKQEFKIKESEYNKEDQEIKKSIEDKEKKMAEVKATLDEHHTHRAEKEKLVKPEWLEKYAVMRERVSNPVVPVENGNCSACFYKITHQHMIEIGKNKMVQCRGCYRFLYLKSEPKSEQK